MSDYQILAIYLLIASAIAIGPMILNRLLAPFRPNLKKYSPYECGFKSIGDHQFQFDIRYYLIAILFIIFDLELAFLFPWSVALDTLPDHTFLAMGFFLFLLLIGFIYEWKKGALEWE